MQEIMISIQSKWVEKILKGEKTVEIRKSFPKCELPCKVFVYCTKETPKLYVPYEFDAFLTDEFSKPYFANESLVDLDYLANGYVVAEFVLNKVSTYDYDIDFENDKQKMYYIRSGELDKTCLTYDELLSYGQEKPLYGWNINNLKVYDTPRELNEFYKNNYVKKIEKLEFNGCDEKHCKYAVGNSFIGDDGYCDYSGCPKLRLQKPPQSWCYIRECIERKE